MMRVYHILGSMAMLHVASTIATVFLSAPGYIVDMGHAVVPRFERFRTLVHIATLTSPLFAKFLAPPIRRSKVIGDALSTFIVVSMMRSVCIAMTVLPPLLHRSLSISPTTLMLGTDTDFIFSGHASFFASWVVSLLRHGLMSARCAATICTIHGIAIISARMHYTIDVVLAWLFVLSVNAVVFMVKNGGRRTTPKLVFVHSDDDARMEDVLHLRNCAFSKELGTRTVPIPGSVWIGVEESHRIVGCVAVTPPSAKIFGLDAYVPRESWDAAVGPGTCEIRALVVDPAYRGKNLASALMYAAFRVAETEGATGVVAMARDGLEGMYARMGMFPTGCVFEKNDVLYRVVSASMRDIRATLDDAFLERVLASVEWSLVLEPSPPTPCAHGATTADYASTDIVRADVLDAWYPPCPESIDALGNGDELARILMTSTSPGCEDLVSAIMRARSIPDASRIVLGAGSSDLIFRAMCAWFGPQSRAMIVSPAYGEYAHVLRHVVRCSRVDTCALGDVRDAVRSGTYDIVVIVNPNSPTGAYEPSLEDIVSCAHPRTIVWIDETYIDFVPRARSLENTDNVVVCKSMSKYYALSGARVAYLCGPPRFVERVRARTPPWVVSGPAQRAAIKALENPGYYMRRRAETQRLRERLRGCLIDAGLEPLDTVPTANFVTAFSPCADLAERCAAEGVFIRDVSADFGRPAVRIAVRLEIDEIVRAVRAVIKK
jgi:histidinol-phosphate/aromatic aminotransferase/cobyric acid decarboxylase-like protein/GNAT superfamily N-acetyltransferase